MTQDEIIEMARQAGMYQDLNVSWNQSIQNFAKLVAAKHDPKIAIADAYRAGVDSGIAAEREACAKLCEDIYTNGDGAECWLENAAKKIRARGEA